MLFNTFMKEMNQSLLLQANAPMQKKPKKVMKDSIKQIRTVQAQTQMQYQPPSNPSSRPRSQLGTTNPGGMNLSASNAL